MNTVTLNQIQFFIEAEAIVLYGVSGNKLKFGNSILKELSAKGFQIKPIHHSIEIIENQQCYKKIADIPKKTESVIICVKPEKAAKLLEELKINGVKNIWFQKGSSTPEIVAKAQKMFPNVIYGKCIMMFAKPEGFHKFHTNVVKFFGGYPKLETEAVY